MSRLTDNTIRYATASINARSKAQKLAIKSIWRAQNSAKANPVRILSPDLDDFQNFMETSLSKDTYTGWASISVR